MSTYFLPLASSEHHRPVEQDKSDPRLREGTGGAAANKRPSEELWGKPENAEFDSWNTVRSASFHAGNVESSRLIPMELWDLERLPLSYDQRTRGFQELGQRYPPLESFHVATREHPSPLIAQSLDRADAAAERRRLADQDLADVIATTSRDDGVFRYAETCAGMKPPPNLDITFERNFRFQDGRPAPGTGPVSEPWSAAHLKAHFDCQLSSHQWKMARNVEKAGFANHFKQQDYLASIGESVHTGLFSGMALSDVTMRSRDSLINSDAQYKSVHCGRDFAKFLQAERQTDSETPRQSTGARSNYSMRVDQPQLCGSDTELKKIREHASSRDDASNPASGYAQERGAVQTTTKADRVIRPAGGKDRHSKVRTSKGLRDRRVRLSVSTAIQFYDIQDRLGFDQPSKAVDWLMRHAKAAIDELPKCPNAPAISEPDSKSSQVFKSSGKGEMAVYSATSQTMSGSSHEASGAPPSLGLEHPDILDSQAIASEGLSVAKSSDAKINELVSAGKYGSQASALQRVHHQQPDKSRNSTSSSASDGSRELESGAEAIYLARAESRANARKRARERTIKYKAGGNSGSF